jgi:hypothetical protein
VTGFPTEEFWTIICAFRPFVVLVWSISILFTLISAVLLVTDATEQGVILVFNLVILFPIALVSLGILYMCRER